MNSKLIKVSVVLACLCVLFAVGACAVTLYALDGRTINVESQADLDFYLANGWYTKPVMTMYAPDGRTTYILRSQVESWKKVGWLEENRVTMYSLDGRTVEVWSSQVNAYKKVGWYEYKSEVTQTLYAR